MVPGDGLDRFKQSFSNTSGTSTTHEIIADDEVYEKLSAPSCGAPGFFPANRA